MSTLKGTGPRRWLAGYGIFIHARSRSGDKSSLNINTECAETCDKVYRCRANSNRIALLPDTCCIVHSTTAHTSKLQPRCPVSEERGGGPPPGPPWRTQVLLAPEARRSIKLYPRLVSCSNLQRTKGNSYRLSTRIDEVRR